MTQISLTDCCPHSEEPDSRFIVVINSHTFRVKLYGDLATTDVTSKRQFYLPQSNFRPMSKHRAQIFEYRLNVLFDQYRLTLKHR